MDENICNSGKDEKLGSSPNLLKLISSKFVHFQVFFFFLYMFSDPRADEKIDKLLAISELLVDKFW